MTDLAAEVEKLVEVHNQVVSLSWVIRELKTTADSAKKCLFDVCKKQGDKIDALFCIYGRIEGRGSLSIRLVRSEDVQESVKEFRKPAHVYIYCVAPKGGLSLESAANALNSTDIDSYFERLNLEPGGSNSGSQVVNETVRRASADSFRKASTKAEQDIDSPSKRLLKNRTTQNASDVQHKRKPDEILDGTPNKKAKHPSEITSGYPKSDQGRLTCGLENESTKLRSSLRNLSKGQDKQTSITSFFSKK